MNAYDAIRTKRDTRVYAEKPIAEETARRILNAGRMAGSSKNTQPCRYVVLRDRQRLAEVAACGQFAKHVPSAPLAIAVVLPETGGPFDAGRAAQNMMVAAWAEGVSSCPVSLHDAECAAKTLGLPAGHRVAILLAFGYPEPSSKHGGAPRLPLEELAHYERW
jgi:nitroreductase